MAAVFPFHAWHYNTSVISDLASVTTQPYDKISPDMHVRYLSHPYNLAHLTLKDPNSQEHGAGEPYARAAETFDRWRREGILCRDEVEGLYSYHQSFTLEDGHSRVQKGFIGLLRLESYGAGVIFPHERTLMGPRQDRLRLLRSTKAQFESLFMLYSDPTGRIDSVVDGYADAAAGSSVTDEYHVQHTIRPITNKAAVDRLQQLMAEQKLIIADGHHRYETALAYRDERRKDHGACPPSAGYDFAMVTFFNSDGPDLTILPTHRVIKPDYPVDSAGLLRFAERYFEVTPVPSAEHLRLEMKNAQDGRPTLGYFGADQKTFYCWRYLDRREGEVDNGGMHPGLLNLDVAILHTLILEKGLGFTPQCVEQTEPIAYVRGFDEALRYIHEGKGSACFLLNPTRINQVRDHAFAGQLLPQKSTDFYPKLLSGLTIYWMDE